MSAAQQIANAIEDGSPRPRRFGLWSRYLGWAPVGSFESEEEAEQFIIKYDMYDLGVQAIVIP